VEARRPGWRSHPRQAGRYGTARQCGCAARALFPPRFAQTQIWLLFVSQVVPQKGQFVTGPLGPKTSKSARTASLSRSVCSRAGDSSRAAGGPSKWRRNSVPPFVPVRLPGIRVTPRPQSEWELLKLQSIGSFHDVSLCYPAKRHSTRWGTRTSCPPSSKSLANHVRYDYVAGFYPASTGGRKKAQG